MNGAHSAPDLPVAGGRTAHAVRPAHLDSRTAERRFAELLDDAIRANERSGDALSNARIGESCDVTESRVRAWRDPHGGRPLTAYRLLQLPDPVVRSLLERVLAARAELRADLGPESTNAAVALAIGSMGRAQADLARALVADEGDDAARDTLAGLLCAVIRDARRLLARFGRGRDFARELAGDLDR